MKKVLWIIPLLLILTACSNDEYQVSDLKISSGTPYIEGVFKNNSNDNCKYVTIDVQVSSGSLKLDQQLSLLNVNAGDVKDIHSYCANCKNLQNNDNVSIKVKNINCSK